MSDTASAGRLTRVGNVDVNALHVWAVSPTAFVAGSGMSPLHNSALHSTARPRLVARER